MLPALTAPLLAKAALPVTAALSYLDAKYLISDDLFLVWPFLTAQLIIKRREREGTINLFYILEEKATSKDAAMRNHPFLVYGNQQWTYKEAYEMVLRYAAWFEKQGVKPMDIVAMDWTNKDTFLWVQFGLWALGATPAFINYNLEGDRLVHCFNVSTAKLLLVDEEVAGVLDNTVTREKLEDGGKRRVMVFDAAKKAEAENTKGYRPDDKYRRWAQLPDAGLLIYTSGTTGMPKPAIVSWQKMLNGSNFAIRWMGLKKEDRFYTSMPLYHSSAMVLGCFQVLQAGCTLVLGHKFSATGTIPELVRTQATIFQYVGETCRYLLASPPQEADRQHKVRIAFGNGMRPDVWGPFKERFNIPVVAEFYAATEGQSGSWNFQSGEFGKGAIGRNGMLTDMILGSKTKLIQLDIDTELPKRDPKTGLCIQCNLGEAGEVIYKVDPENIKATFQGYFGNEKATNSKIIRDVFAKGDAWYRTGDLQRRDPGGLWYFIDRIGDTFRWKSENVSTAEVADVLGESPLVNEVVVYGVGLPNHDGRCGCAAVELTQDADKHTFIKGLEDAVKSLPRYARPVFVRIVPELERTGNNKLVKQSYKEAGVDVEKKEIPEIYWCPKAGEGYKPFDVAALKDIQAGRVKL
ncbi:putative long-chain fatty acid transporter [Ascodesmis nigricans]|uniref:Very long-chain fatty acid transport protein n=1 Tax=Ascodesmis nigricans TaxID=341454 RepID=A0A4S2MZB1_9PEZI|nr:putative long-chain fatty acid transporter [Ascodesmis nigricans]